MACISVTLACAAASVPNMAGLGKYSPNTMADRSLPAEPRVILLSFSKELSTLPNRPYRIAAAHAKVTEMQAMLAEAIGTALLVFFIFALTDARNRNRPDGTLFAVLIGLTITILICVIAPLTQAGFNPARDFAPRLVAYFAGWGSIAIPGPRGGFLTVYILSPILGGIVGGLIYDYVIRPPAPAEPSGRVSVDGAGLKTETTETRTTAAR
jgi:hypothetical protein